MRSSRVHSGTTTGLAEPVWEVRTLDRKTLIVLAVVAVALFLVIRDPVGAAANVQRGFGLLVQAIQGLWAGLNEVLAAVSRGG